MKRREHGGRAGRLSEEQDHSTPKTTAAIAARLTAPRQVGGLSRRSPRRWRAICFASSRGLRAAGAPGALDGPGLGAAVLATALALRLGHGRIDATGGRERVLDHVPLGIEAAQRHVLREALERGPRREPDQLRLGDLRALARRARRGRAAAPRGGRARWSTPGRARARRGRGRCARTPGSPPPDSRSSAAIACASSTSSLGEVDVERDQRRARGGEHRARRRVRRGAGRSPGRARRTGDALPPAPPGRPRAGRRARRAPAASRARRRGTPAGRARRRSSAAAVSASAQAAPRRSSSRYTTGTTSSAPTCGWRPSWAAGRSARPPPRARPTSARRQLALRAPRG